MSPTLSSAAGRHGLPCQRMASSWFRSAVSVAAYTGSFTTLASS